ncbi:MAG: RnfABCDGE type electron transport complex subunit D [Candidatus Saganbacteria bacterium]|nr:RnfABCDGE type electron transport complex subunit D [Candidatus Saganbacteria bacterium]
MSNEKLLVGPAPHFRAKEDSEGMMRDVIIALLPALFLSIYFFGILAAIVVIVAVVSSLVFEYIMLRARKKTATKTDYYSAALTGLLLAFCITSATPFWAVIVGSAVAIVIAKHFFGGLGFNIFNPALVGRAFLLASYPVMMTTWFKPMDAITGPTPLNLIKEQGISTALSPLFFGNVGGSIGETSALALIIGGLYLLYRKAIDFRIPVSYFGTVIIFSHIFGVDPLFHLLAGGLMLGAIYMATDPVTSPVSRPGGWFFGAGCGLITMVIRLWGGYPEGVCYSILLMNAVVPLLDRYLPGTRFGAKRRLSLKK